jgi:hypothetical protein
MLGPALGELIARVVRGTPEWFHWPRRRTTSRVAAWSVSTTPTPRAARVRKR